MKVKKQRRSDNRELNQARSKPDIVDRPVRTVQTFLHHYNSTQYCIAQRRFFKYIPSSKSTSGELRHDWLGWWSESGSWFQRWSDAYLNEWSVKFQWGDGWWVGKGNNRWRAGTARGLNGDQVVKIARSTSC